MPDRLAGKVVEFLVSHLSAEVTGQVTAVDGGVCLFPT
jgi:enoyl-[acyl-carrier-protein] reductase (NADH)